jgi:hypothetical protein
MTCPPASLPRPIPVSSLICSVSVLFPNPSPCCPPAPLPSPSPGHGPNQLKAGPWAVSVSLRQFVQLVVAVLLAVEGALLLARLLNPPPG